MKQSEINMKSTCEKYQIPNLINDIYWTSAQMNLNGKSFIFNND